MSKRLFLLSIFGIVFGLITSSEALTAADSFVPVEPDFHAVETVPLPEPEPEPEPEAPAAPVMPQLANYTVTIQTAEIVAHNLSYYDIYKTEKLVYGHNSNNLLGSLAYRYAGETFTITEGGVTRNYRVAAVVTYAKTADGYLNGDPMLMGDIMRTAMGYDVALMTCAGTGYGNGDASHRLVVYADAI
ncbi:MAG: hypothetical protein Q4F56_02225 [Candidatus Saccharibacteria bacterium]|nr:hypothetical protein [Candidatus Saccharibacteria bacterium]